PISHGVPSVVRAGLASVLVAVAACTHAPPPTRTVRAEPQRDERPHPSLAYFPTPLPVDQYPPPPPSPDPSCIMKVGYDPVTRGLEARLRNCLVVAQASDPVAHGKIVIAFDASEDGSIDAVRVVESSAPAFLDRCAVDALINGSRPIAE